MGPVYFAVDASEERQGFGNFGNPTLAVVAAYWGHARPTIEVQLRTGEFAVSPLTTSFRDLKDARGQGSAEDPFVVRIESAGLLQTKQQVLKSRLPTAQLLEDTQLSKDAFEPRTSAFRIKPEKVCVWGMSPDGSCSLEEAVKQHVTHADNEQRIFDAFPTIVLQVDGPERDVQERLDNIPMIRLGSFMEAAGKGASWRRELSLHRVATLFQCFSTGALPAQSAGAEPQVQQEVLQSAPTRPHSTASKFSTRLTPDFVLMRSKRMDEAPHRQQQPEQPRQLKEWQRATSDIFAVSATKRVGQCLREGEPVDLVSVHEQQDSEDRLCQSVRRMLRQLFTCMVLTGVQFGWLSCWRATWLAWRPLAEPRLLMLSRPFKDSDGGGPGGGNTVMAALSWLQDLAFDAQDQRHEIDLSLIPGESELLDDELDDADGGSDSPPDDGHPQDMDFDPPEPEGKSRKPSRAQPPGKPAPALPKGQSVSIPLLPAEAVVVWSDVLGQGSSCVVLHGQCKGQEAALKVLTCNKPLQAAKNEAAIYQVLVDLQGKQVPCLLGVGRLALGPVFIATALVRGVPLSQLPSLSHEVRAAAMLAVGEVHKRGVVHGDLLLEHMLLVRQPSSEGESMDRAVGGSGRSSSSSSSGSPSSLSPPQVQAVVDGASSSSGGQGPHGRPQVMVIDFGRAYTQASPEAVQDEARRARQLLGIRGQRAAARHSK